jgi:transposase
MNKLDRWPTEVTCPLCGGVGEARKMGGETQKGMFLCNAVGALLHRHLIAARSSHLRADHPTESIPIEAARKGGVS